MSSETNDARRAATLALVTDVPVEPAPLEPTHIVQFYEDENFLIDSVARFVGTGLGAGEPVLIIATPEHRAAFRAALADRAFDVDRAEAAGNLRMLDARETLATFMVGDSPDWDRYLVSVGSCFARLAGRRVRAYGEMVDLLFRDGNAAAAIELEDMWNRLARFHSFSLLCAYVMGNFYKEPEGGPFEAVCKAHTHVWPAEGFAALGNEDDRHREVASLQRRARALATEVDQRKQLEQALLTALAEREHIAQALARSREELQDFVDSAPYGLHWLDASGHIRWANRAELAMLGYDEEEYIGRHIADLHADPPVIEDILARLARNEVLCAHPARLRHKDGSIRHVVIDSSVYWRDGKFVHTQCFTRDVTSHTVAEDRLRAVEEERVALLEGETAARASAEAANRAKDEFLAMLGHELRNPLAPIVTALQLARLRGSSSREIDVIERQIGHLTRLVDDLLDVSRIIRGKINLRLETFEIAEAIAQAIETVSPLLEQRRQTISIEVPRKGCAVAADRARMAQVVANLLTNASKYSDLETRITVAAGARAGSVWVRVTDAGMGIASEMIERVFEPFVQQPQARDRSQGGLGVGLAIVKNLVEQHGGRVSVKSDGPGLGCQFTAELPAAQVSVAAAEPPALPPIDPQPVRVRVLLVDDNEDAALLMQEALIGLGYEVRVAHDGPAALRVADDFRPEVGLLDIGLPVMDGYELAGRLRSETWASSLKLVALTGYGQENDKTRSRDAGFADHLVKPIDLSLIDQTVRGLVDPS